MSDAANGAAPKTAPRQYVQFIFYKVDAAWRRLPAEEREASKREAVAAIESMASTMQVRPYSLVGVRGDADFMLWHIADDLAPFQQAATGLLGTSLGAYLSTPYAYLSLTRKSQYVDKTENPGAAARLRLTPGTAKYLFVYPFVKTRPWYNLPQDKRQALMDTHIRIGRRYPTVKLNTTYSFGLDDQEFVVAFETDAPADFLDLVMELRETESSLYTLRDTPTFTCVSTTVRGALDALDGASSVVAPAAAKDGWARVASLADVAAAPVTAYVDGEQVVVLRAEGQVYALQALCPHAAAPFASEGRVAGHILTCTRHGSQYDLADGCAVVRGPASRPPVVYDVRLDGDDIYVQRALPVP